MRSYIRVLTIASVLLFTAAGASADDVGEVGTVAGLQIVNDSADTFLQYHGRLFVLNGAKQIDEYRWGGTSCGSRVLEVSEVAALQAALDNKKVKIAPLYQPGQGLALCLVSFQIVPKQFVNTLLP